MLAISSNLLMEFFRRHVKAYKGYCKVFLVRDYLFLFFCTEEGGRSSNKHTCTTTIMLVEGVTPLWSSPWCEDHGI
jgi:hypothetical protein